MPPALARDSDPYVSTARMGLPRSVAFPSLNDSTVPGGVIEHVGESYHRASHGDG